MGLFDSILTKLGLKKVATTPAPATPASTPGLTPRQASTSSATTVGTTYSAAPASAVPVSAIPVVDVVSKIEAMAKKNPMKLNWKQSIVDLLVVLDLPHGANDLKELAVDLKCPANIVDDSFKRNMWLHKAVLKAIAANGGNIPKNLLD
jgi:hypothetical protein